LTTNPSPGGNRANDMSNKKHIKDYLHYYIGCDVLLRLEGYENPMPITGIGETFFVLKFQNGDSKIRIQHINCIRLILRPLSSMTDEELNVCGNMIYDFSDDPELSKHKWRDFEIGLAPEQFHYLLQQGFDLFGLIESGLAIDKTKI